MNPQTTHLDDKKIAVLLPSYVGGGAERISDLIFSGLMNRYGYKVELITGELNDITRQRAIEVGYEVTDLSEIGPNINTAEAKEYFLNALKRSDAKHIVYAVAIPDKAARYRSELPGRNIIYHLHSLPLWEAREKIQVGRRLIKAMDSTGKYVKWYISKYLKEKWFKVYSHRFARRYRTLFAHVDHVVVLTDSYRHLLNKMVGNITNTRKEEKISTIYNPFDPTPFLPLAEKTKQKEIIYVGRLSCVDKGVDHLLRAWHRICRSYPEWKLKIVGTGPDRPYLEWLVYVLSIQNVEFCGYTSDPSIHYDSASIICLPSNFEGWPTVLIEAMAAGVVPLAVDCSGGVHEILNDNRGVLVKPGKDYLIAKSLRKMIENPEDLAERRKLYPDFLKKINVNTAVDSFQKLLN